MQINLVINKDQSTIEYGYLQFCSIENREFKFFNEVQFCVL